MKHLTNVLVPILLAVVFIVWFVLFADFALLNMAAWMGFVFAIIGCLIGIVPMLVAGKDHASNAALVGIAYAFMAAEVVASLAIILLNPADWAISFFVQLLILVAFIAVFVAMTRASAATDAAVAKNDASRSMIQGWQHMIQNASRVQGLDPQAEKELERAYDALRSTPIRSIGQTYDVDSSIAQAVDEAMASARAKDSDGAMQAAQKIESLVMDRNTILSMNA